MDAIVISDAARPLGSSGLVSFPIAYGCWRFAGSSVSEARRKIEAAIEIGIELFDHADIYGGNGAAEDLFGRVLDEAPGLRDAMFVATKCGIVVGTPYNSSGAHIRLAVEASLRRLRIETIDLYQIHRPDLLAHPDEIAAAFAELKEQGKILSVGVSNYTVAQTEALRACLPFALATTQPEISCWWLESFRDGTLDLCMREEITPLAWSPLAGGKLGLSVEQARRETNGERLAALITKLDELAEREGVSRSAIALAFLLVHPAKIIPIIGTQKVERIRESLDAFKVRLSRQDWYGLFAASQGKPLP